MVWPRLLLVMVMVMMLMMTGFGEEEKKAAEEEEENHPTQTEPLARQRLRGTLLRNYDKETMPSLLYEPQIVTLKHFYIRNLEMHEERHRLHISASVTFTWVDQRLVWDPYASNSSDIRRLTFNPRSLWVPDLTFYNAVSDEDVPLVSKNRLLVNHEGVVLLATPIDLSFFCVANLTHWPSDTHECRLKIASWMHDSLTLELMVEDAITTELGMEVTKHPQGSLDTMEWEVVGSAVYKARYVYACCEEFYTNLQVIFIIRRDAPAYNWLIKTPVVFLMLLTLVVFVLPPGASEKITFGGLCLLLNLLFLLFTNSMVRHAPNHTPLLVQLVVVQLVMISASVLVASFTVRAARGPYFSSPPSCVHSLSLSLAHCLCLFAYVRKILRRGRVENERPKNEEIELRSEGKCDVQEVQSGIADQRILLGAVLDRIAFVVYLIVCAVLLVQFFYVN